MFKKFHIQMTFFCTIIVSLIIVIMTISYLSIAESSMDSINYANFQNNCNTTLTYLGEQNVISHQWVSSTEHNNQFMIQVYDNQLPLSITNMRLSEDDLSIIDKIKKRSVESYALNIESEYSNQRLMKKVEFKMTIASEKYYVATALIPKIDGFMGVIIYQPLSIYQDAILKQRLIFFSIDIVSILLLGAFSWFFTSRMIKPLEQTRRQQTRFIASASHELRSPLTVMLSSLSAMKKGNPDEARHFADTIESEGKRMSRLIDDMLSLANADNKTWSLKPEPVELDTLLLNVYEKYEPMATDKGYQLNISLPEETTEKCICDSSRIEQVLSILIDNAFSYTPVGSCISLSLIDRGNKQELRVADNGPGIAAGDRTHIFERFYRGDVSHTKKEHFGLGLSIAKEIIQLHKGMIFVDQTDSGTCFVIQLPHSR